MKETTKITYTVRKNYLTPMGGEDAGYWGHVIRSSNAVGRDYIVNLMSRKNTTVSRQDIISVLDLFAETVKDLMSQGFSIETGLFNSFITMKGKFESEDDLFDPRVHSLKINMTPDPSVIKYVTTFAELRKIKNKTLLPEIKTVYDYATRTTNEFITPGHTVELIGTDLNMEADNETHGLYIKNTILGADVKITTIHKQTKLRIVFTVPENLEPEEYEIEFRGGTASIPKKYTLPVKVTVPGEAAAA